MIRFRLNEIYCELSTMRFFDKRKNCLKDSIRCIFGLRTFCCDCRVCKISLSLCGVDRDILTQFTAGRPSRNFNFVSLSMTVCLSDERARKIAEKVIKGYLSTPSMLQNVSQLHPYHTCNGRILHHCNPLIKPDTAYCPTGSDICGDEKQEMRRALLKSKCNNVERDMFDANEIIRYPRAAHNSP